ncbi:MAG: bifunctional 5,10-methylenetetrahydrofolate dehydrogenase/5,10-methenyltetrahydrofolate cyclohydrolase [Acetobacteraceae bacterium]
MPARIIDGREVAASLNAETQRRIAEAGITPRLVIILAGDDPASSVYVRNKDRAARKAGVDAETIRLPADVSEIEVLGEIGRLNADASVDGILVQLPLPGTLRPRAVIEAIDPAKDVDGLTPVNAGRLMAGQPGLVPCTPLGVMKLLAAADIRVPGARAMVIGRSSLVGRPLAALLTAADATVTLAHSKTRNLPAECRRAEILVAAIGRAELVRGDWIGEGAVVIDVGINHAPDGTLLGDVAFTEALPRARAITPVPGGVGPMTIACLLENTLTAALARRGPIG